MKHIKIILLLLFCSKLSAQVTIVENRQVSFPSTIPAGNYSGITWLGGNRYAVVSDKSREEGFFIFEIDIDSVSGKITDARNTGFFSNNSPGRDLEDIAYNPLTNTLWITGERDNRVIEHDMSGKRTGRELPLPAIYKHLTGRRGMEALSFNEKTNTYWTCNESDTIFIQAYDSLLRPCRTLKYWLEKGEADGLNALEYAHGVGAICALDDGSLLVMEREFFVPKSKLGAFVKCKLFLIIPGKNTKKMLAEWRTSLTLFGRDLANYEGMCLGPTLSDGARVIILVADSQNQYAGVLKDWMKSLTFERVPLAEEQPVHSE